MGRLFLPSVRTALCTGAFVLMLATGCGTSRWTDTQRTISEQLLISDAIDRCVGQIDFSTLAGRSVYIDDQFLGKEVDSKYLLGSLRERLVSCGCHVSPTAEKADVIVELRAGGVGTDRHDRLLLGVPEMVVPVGFAGPATKVPEIAFIKETEQMAIAKLGLFAYDRQTGAPLWKSGLVQERSDLSRRWMLGNGPDERGRTATQRPYLADRWRRVLTPWRREPLPRQTYRSGFLWQEALFAMPPVSAPPPSRQLGPIDQSRPQRPAKAPQPPGP